ncbi:MAG: hypothetical protein COA69_11690 [Robiginitomaculum sp.]|nr:MAG: hypothetical protein COA69_11690 [Robiginitomaculum sp.]
MTGLQNTSTDTMFAPLSSTPSKDGRADGKSADASKNGEEPTADMFANMFELLEHSDINTGAVEYPILADVSELNTSDTATPLQLVQEDQAIPEIEIAINDLAITKSLLGNVAVMELSENPSKIGAPTATAQTLTGEFIAPSVTPVPASVAQELAIAPELAPKSELEHLANTTKAAPVSITPLILAGTPLALAGEPEAVKTHAPLQITPTSAPISGVNENTAATSGGTSTAPVISSVIRTKTAIVLPISEQLILSESLPQTSSQNIPTEDAPKAARTSLPLPAISAEQGNAGTDTGTDTGQKQGQAPQSHTPQKSEMAALAPNTAVDTSPISTEFRVAENASITTSTLASKTATTPAPQIATHVAVQQVGNAIIQRGDKGGDIVLRLDPAELGRVEISFTFDKTNGVTANVVAETAQTAAILRERSDILSAQLKQSGFDNINLSFDTREDSQSGKGFGAQFSDQQRTDKNAQQQQTKFFDVIAQEEQGTATSIVNTPTVHVSGSDAIDIKL